MAHRNKIIGRQSELQILARILQSKQPEFLAIYGRRRVGKTFLIRSYFQDHRSAVFFNVTGMKDGKIHEQIKNFVEQIAEIFLPTGTKLAPCKDWREAFKTLTDQMKHVRSNKKIILFLDELPWMATRNSRLLQVLEYFWNQHWSQDTRIKLIVCGSSASWILNNIVNNRRGLYNRVTHSILLEPFNLSETSHYLQAKGVELNNQQVLQIYMALGGIPHYLAQVSPGKTAVKVIEELAFSKHGFLLREFDNLFSTLFDQADAYIDLVRAIASKRYGIDKASLSKKYANLSSGGGLNRKLDNLEQAGFINSFMPHNQRKKGKFFKVIDEYTLFYFYWIEPVKQTLQTKSLRRGYWDTIQQLPSWHSWSGYAFESICFKHLSQISHALGMTPASIPTSWRYVPNQITNSSKKKGAQIDLLFDCQDNSFVIVEIKHTKQPFVADKAFVDALRNKMEVFKRVTRTKKQLLIAIVSSSGLKKSTYASHLITAEANLNDLFKDIE